MAQLRQAVMPAGLEEDDPRRGVEVPSQIEFPGLVSSATFQAERAFLEPYQLDPHSSRVSQILRDAVLARKLNPSVDHQVLQRWLVEIPCYLVTDQLIWAAYAKRAGVVETSAAIVRLSKTTGSSFIAIHAASPDLGLWVREAIRARLTRFLLWEMLWHRQQQGRTSPFTPGWLTAMRETDGAWDALLGQTRGPALARVLRSRFMDFARHGPLPHDKPAAAAWNSLRGPRVIETTATLFTVLLIPDWAPASPALRDLANWLRRMDIGHPVHLWLRPVWTTALPGLSVTWPAIPLPQDVRTAMPRVPLRRIRRFENAAALAFSPTGDAVAVVEQLRSVRLFRVPSWEPQWCAEGGISNSAMVNAITFDADGRSLVAVRNDGALVRWDVASGESQLVVRPINDRRVILTAFDSERRLMAVSWSDGTVTFQDFDGHAQDSSCSFPPEEVVTALTFDPTGRYVALGGEWGTLALWDREQGRFAWQFLAHAKWVSALAFSPDGHALFSASRDGTLARWDVATAGAVWEQTLSGVSAAAVAVGPGGRLLFVAWNHGNLWFCEALTGRWVGAAFNAPIQQLVWAPQRPWLAAIEGHRTIRIWDAGLAMVWDRLPHPPAVPREVGDAIQLARRILERSELRSPVAQVQDALDLRAAIQVWHAAILDAPGSTAHTGFGSLEVYSRDFLRDAVRDRSMLAQALTTVGRARTLINEWLEQTVPELPRMKVVGDTDAWRTAPVTALVEARYDAAAKTLFVAYPAATSVGLEEVPTGELRRRDVEEAHAIFQAA